MKKNAIRLLSLILLLSICFSIMLPTAYAESLTIDAKSALLVDMNSGQVLFEQDADERRYPASITKIMTALLTIEAVSRGDLALDTVITAPDNCREGMSDDSSTANIVPGEELTVEQLLYCLMLVSANEAANILAVAVAGDIPSFVELMNKRAQELGMTGTHFVNPNGLHNMDHYSTARDICTMATEGMTHATFRTVVSTASYIIPPTNKSEERLLYNTNGLLTALKYPGYTYSYTIGIKTGTTDQAGYCVVAAAEHDGLTLLSVILGADNIINGNKITRTQFIECKRLLKWGYENFAFATMLDADTYMQDIPVKFSSSSNHVIAVPEHSVQFLIDGQFDKELLTLNQTLKSDTLKAPIFKGQSVGTIDVVYNGKDYGTVDLIATNDVDASPVMLIVHTVDSIIGSLFIRIILGIALVVVLVLACRRFFSERARKVRQERRMAKAARDEQRRIAREEEQAQRAQQRERRREQRQRERQQMEYMEQKRAQRSAQAKPKAPQQKSPGPDRRKKAPSSPPPSSRKSSSSRPSGSGRNRPSGNPGRKPPHGKSGRR